MGATDIGDGVGGIRGDGDGCASFSFNKVGDISTGDNNNNADYSIEDNGADVSCGDGGGILCGQVTGVVHRGNDAEIGDRVVRKIFKGHDN